MTAGSLSPGGIPYSVRVSDRAQRIRLTVTPRDGLVVVVPRGLRVDVGALVDAKSAWANRALSQISAKRDLFLAGPDGLLPQRVELRISGTVLEVDYRSSDSATARVDLQGLTLVVRGSADGAARLMALQRWLGRTARDVLPVRLAQVALRHGLHYSAVRITSAKTRWGSCSASGRISLNRSLLLLPSDLAESVMLHELAHTTVMNHSPRFWSTLVALDPHAMAQRERLRSAGLLLPAWVEA